jgi:acyl-CoA dehydrogenase
VDAMYSGNPDVPEDVFADVLKQIKDFVRARVVPRESDIMTTDAIPGDLRSSAAEMGLFGYAIPQEWGGLGLDLVQDVEVAMELGYTSLAFRSMFGTNNGIAGQVLVGFGTEAQKARWLPGLAAGDVVASFALTEPGAGSNPAGLRTTATADGDGWVIDGSKRFITNATDADLFVVFARLRPAPDAGNGIAVFLVPAATPGVEVGVKDAKMGQEGSRTADVTFTQVRVGPEALVGGDGEVGYRAAMTSLARGRIHIAGLAVGCAQRALDESVAYAASATQGGTPIGEFQLVQAMLADSQAELYATRSMTLDAARKRDNGENVTLEAACCKLYASEMVGRVADRGVQIHGGAGYMQESVVERFYCDVRLFRLYEGTSQIQQLIIARNMLKRARA